MSGRVLLGMTILLAAACTKPADTPAEQAQQTPDNSLMRVINGTVLYRERRAPAGEAIEIVVSKTGGGSR